MSLLKSCVYLGLVIGIFTFTTTSATARSLLVSSNSTNQILQYNLETGSFEKVFADAAVLGTDPVGGNLLSEPTGMDIGPDGNLYVAYRDGLSDATTGGILKFGLDGSYLGVFSTAVTNIQELDFGPDGNLYVARFEGGADGINCILGPDDPTPGVLDPNHTPIGAVNGVEPYFDPVTESVCYFRSISALGGQVRLSDKSGATLAILDGPWAVSESPAGLEFGPDGHLYLAARNSATNPEDIHSGIYKFDVSTIDYTSGTGGVGTFTKVADAPELETPLGIAFDMDDNILVSSYTDSIEKYNLTDGTYMGQKIATSEGGLENPHFGLIILPEDTPEPIPGDANNDQKVDGSDVTILAGNWQAGVDPDDTTEVTWEMGDFNGDGQVDGSDVTILAGNWQAGVTTTAASVPEPGTIILLVSGLMVVSMWRRKE